MKLLRSEIAIESVGYVVNCKVQNEIASEVLQNLS
jgi:hypothetical protein